MRVMSLRPLKEFWERKDTPPKSEELLRAWYDHTENATWGNFAELKQTFGSADTVGDCVVFDVGNNRIRLIGRVRYANDMGRGIVYVLKVMTHAEYDEDKWPDECGCHKKPPKKDAPRPTKKKTRKKK